MALSLSLRRAWIEMSRPQRRIPSLSSRSPYGERGLKSERSHSLPVGMRRSPYGERGLKYELYDGKIRTAGRSPYGERGLKSLMVAGVVVPEAVALLTESVD